MIATGKGSGSVLLIIFALERARRKKFRLNDSSTTLVTVSHLTLSRPALSEPAV